MIDTSDVAHLLTDLLGRVEPFDPATAFRLRLLNDSIKNDDVAAMDAWASTDLYQLIDPESIVARFTSYQATRQENKPGDNLLQALKSARTVLFFLPFLLIGFALLQATRQYASSITTQPDIANLPFLYLWQQGFNGALPGWLTFGGVVLITLFLLILLFLLTLMGSLLTRSRKTELDQQEHDREQEAQSLRSDLGQALAAATLYLAKQKRSLTSSENLERVSRRIDTVARTMEQRFEYITNQFDAMTKRVTNNFDALAQNATNNLEGTTRRFEKDLSDTTRQMTGAFTNMTQNVTNNFDGMVKDVAAKYDALAEQLTVRFTPLADQLLAQLTEGRSYLKQMGNLTGGVIQTAEQLRQTATVLKQSNADLVLSMDNLLTPVNGLARQQASLGETATQSLALLQQVARTMTDLSKQQERWGTDLRNILDTLDLTIERAAELVADTNAKDA